MKFKLSIIFILLAFIGYSQSNNNFVFEEGSRICFVGNSITHEGGFHHNVMLYQMTRFPQEKVTFYNCGIGGNQAHDVLNRMKSDILIHDPTHVVIMLGMNDVHRNLYGNYSTTNQDTLRKRKEAINNYKNNLDSIVRIFRSKNVKVLLQKPSIYDQTAIIPAKNYYGVNNALKECAEFNQQLASEYDLPVIDYWSIMEKINKEIQKKDPAATIIGKDRVHPGATGHFIMTYQFLKTMNATQYVSEIIVGKDKSSERCVNCNVEYFDNDKPGCLSFRATEKALPFPVSEDQEEGANLIPFTKELNTQLFQVPGIKRGQYQLKIDDVIIGDFSSQQLKKGVNLAEFNNTPQYGQSEKVLEVLQELWRFEEILRDLKFIEYGSTFKNYTGNKDNLNEFREYYLEKASNSNYKTYLEYVIDRYVKNKPKQKHYEDEIIKLRKEAYQLSQPVPHNFEIGRI